MQAKSGMILAMIPIKSNESWPASPYGYNNNARCGVTDESTWSGRGLNREGYHRCRNQPKPTFLGDLQHSASPQNTPHLAALDGRLVLSTLQRERYCYRRDRQVKICIYGRPWIFVLDCHSLSTGLLSWHLLLQSRLEHLLHIFHTTTRRPHSQSTTNMRPSVTPIRSRD